MIQQQKKNNNKKPHDQKSQSNTKKKAHGLIYMYLKLKLDPSSILWKEGVLGRWGAGIYSI